MEKFKIVQYEVGDFYETQQAELKLNELALQGYNILNISQHGRDNKILVFIMKREASIQNME